LTVQIEIALSRLVGAAILYGLCASAVAAQAALADDISRSVVPPNSGGGGFLENCGQWHPDVRFAVRTGSGIAWIHDDGWTVRPPGDHPQAQAARFTFEGAAAPGVRGGGLLDGRHHFLVGSDRDRWRSNVRGFAHVDLEQLYDGVDVRFRQQGRRLEYDLLLAHYADLSSVILKCAAAESASVADDGALVLQTPAGVLRQTAPRCWQRAPDGEVTPVDGHFRILDATRYGFEVEGWRPAASLVIDPGLEWGSYLGGTDSDVGRAVAFDPSGDVLMVGRTWSMDFPISEHGWESQCDPTPSFGCRDIVIARFARESGALQFSTHFGGDGAEDAVDIFIDSTVCLTICGETSSGSDFPVTAGTFHTAQSGSSDVFVSRFSPDGSQLLLSCAFGGSSFEDPRSMVMSAAGEIIIGGQTGSSDFPTTPGALDSTKGLNGDGFLLRLNASFSALDFATYLGGDSSDSVGPVALDPAGNILIAGGMSAGSVPVTPGAYSAVANGPYVARIAGDGSAVLESTYIGGSLSDPALAIGSLANGEVVIGGWTFSDDYPVTPGAFQTTPIGSLFRHGYITRFDAGLSNLVFSTYLSTGAGLEVHALHVDPGGSLTLGGYTRGGLFPSTPGAFDPSPNGAEDAFLARLSADGSKMIYATLLGGSDQDTNVGEDVGLGVDPYGAAALCTFSHSLDFPTTPGAAQPQHSGDGADAVIAVLDMLPTGVTRYGSSTPGCTGLLAMGVTAMPRVGQPFGLTCNNAPPLSAQGLLFLGLSGLGQPLAAKGAALWVNPLPTFLLVPVSSDLLGAVWLQGTIPNKAGLVGAKIYTQVFWTDPCLPLGTLSASNALEIEIQG
jgi:hypothetical protein